MTENIDSENKTKFDFLSCSEAEMQKCVRKMKNGKTDSLGITSNMLKLLNTKISKYLTSVFNTSIKSCVFPSYLKKPNLTNSKIN